MDTPVDSYVSGSCGFWEDAIVAAVKVGSWMRYGDDEGSYFGISCTAWTLVIDSRRLDRLIQEISGWLKSLVAEPAAEY